MTMNLYLVKRTDSIGWDEHDAIVVRAKDADRAREIAFTGHYDGPYSGFTPDNIEVTEVTPDGNEAVILASFHAG
jgi:hypothetical protein